MAEAARRMAGLDVGALPSCGADDEVQEILRTMAAYKVRRLPVLDKGRLVGMVAQADVARVGGASEEVGQVLA